MKSVIIWLSAVIVGGILGYGIGFLIVLNVYLTTGIGIIAGSSMGITINIHRERELHFFEEEEEFEEDSTANVTEKISQKPS